MKRVFKPRPKPVYKLNIGGDALIAEFYLDKNDIKNCYLHIYAPNSTFIHRVSGDTYGYLLTAVAQGRDDEVEAYCAMIWRVSGQVYSDPDFCSDIVEAINALDGKLLERAQAEAEKVTEDNELASQALMSSIASEAEMPASERKKARARYRSNLEEIAGLLRERNA